jgi:hypothetical protein
MRYVDALKIWNQIENNGKWCFPSKGSEPYKQIILIMQNGGIPKKQIKFKVKQQAKPEPKKQIKFKKIKQQPKQEPKKRIKFKKKQGSIDGEGMILPGYQRGRGDFPLEFAVEFAQDPMKYVNKLGSFMDSTSGTKQMALQIERESGAKRLFKWPWE